MSPNINLREALAQQEALFDLVRQFFKARGLVEVQTPLLEPAPNPSPYLDTIKTSSGHFLPTSPEFEMKWLLAHGSGDIFQLCKAFRAGELGRWHREEFNILEWYRTNFTLEQLAKEALELFSLVLNLAPQQIHHLHYADAFEKFVNLNPHLATSEQLQEMAKQRHIEPNERPEPKVFWLQLLFEALIEPELKQYPLVLIDDFPCEEAMLAQIQPSDGVLVAKRFEVYSFGLEIANAFLELTDPEEQRRRFQNELAMRRQMQLDASLPMPERFLSALSSLPPCAGIAAGLDRLLARRLKRNSLLF